MSSIINIVTKFLKKHESDRPFLLGLSGGEDSSCLFHILCSSNIPFMSVYVDHRWRKESEQEAHTLELACQKAGVPFFKENVIYGETGLHGNLEDFCRNERRRIFQDLVKKHNLSAVILAHHAQDQAETVLKRVFEGASLLKFKGMDEVSQDGPLKILRPLLMVSKEEIQKYVNFQQISYFQDSTNFDSRFLRGRMRKSLFPQINAAFGKNIEKPLIRLAAESSLLNDFLEKRVDILLKQGKWGPFGYFLDLSLGPIHEIEARYLIQQIGTMLKITFSKDQLEQASIHLVLKTADKRVDQQLYFDRGRLFYLKPFPWNECSFPGVKIVHDENQHDLPYKGWTSLWDGERTILLPKKNYLFKPLKVNTKMVKLWTQNKTPKLLRSLIPGIYEGETLVYDLLSASKAFT